MHSQDYISIQSKFLYLCICGHMGCWSDIWKNTVYKDIVRLNGADIINCRPNNLLQAVPLLTITEYDELWNALILTSPYDKKVISIFNRRKYKIIRNVVYLASYPQLICCILFPFYLPNTIMSFLTIITNLSVTASWMHVLPSTERVKPARHWHL